MSEKKPKKYDIRNVHEFIDTITLPPQGTASSYTEIKQKLLQKKLFAEPTPTTSPSFQEGYKDTLPPRETVTPETGTTDFSYYDTNDVAGLPEFEPVPENLITNAQDEDWLSTYDLLEIEVTWETHQGLQGMNEGVFEPVPLEGVPAFEPVPILDRSGAESPSRGRKNDRQAQKQLRKELNQKVKRERQAYLKQEKEARRLTKLKHRKRTNETRLTTSKKNE